MVSACLSFFLSYIPLRPGAGSAPPKRREAKEGKKKILIVMSHTGGGHLASAKAITAGLEELNSADALEIKIIDILEEYTLWFPNRLYNVSNPGCPALLFHRLCAYAYRVASLGLCCSYDPCCFDFAVVHHLSCGLGNHLHNDQENERRALAGASSSNQITASARTPAVLLPRNLRSLGSDKC